MKKGLSVLLIAAALFGFYGGATSLTDVLASKDYWEEEGEKSTADMNKLEDGLNQLKDNEQAYLDGQKTLADGEKKLADAEVQLEEGRATLAKGYADYAAAPAKLADARRQIADGEEQLAEGAANLEKLGNAVGGINKILNGYNNTWKPGYDALHENRQKLVKGLDATADPNTGATVMQVLLGSVAPQLGTAQAAFEKAVKGIDDKNQFADGYKTFASNGRTVAQGVSTLISSLKDSKAGADSIVGACSTTTEIPDPENPEHTIEVPTITAGLLNPKTSKATEAGLRAVLEGAKLPSEQIDGLVAGVKNPKTASGYASQIKTIASGVSSAIQDSLNGLYALQKAYTNNLVKFADAVDENIDALQSGQDEMANGIRTIASGVLGNKTLKDGVREAMGSSAIQLLETYNNNPNPANSSVCDFAKFEGQMDTNPGLVAILQKARGFLGQTIADGTDTYNAGLRKLNAGKAEYRQGLADYAAAPAKLADGEKQLADGEKQYADGKKQLADGKKKLAEYEDGEQQVRDGLATLMATKADPGLESILDRRNGDDKFDDAKGHLQLDEGLEAVDIGRGYQADSGELITKEVTNRAIGTAAGLGAAALAVLAAVLSFLKKNKGAAVSAVLAAVAGGIGAGVGFGAGEYYSDIAGSTVGNTPFIAAAVLAAVAAVFAIVHFTAQPEAKPEAK